MLRENCWVRAGFACRMKQATAGRTAHSKMLTVHSKIVICIATSQTKNNKNTGLAECAEQRRNRRTRRNNKSWPGRMCRAQRQNNLKIISMVAEQKWNNNQWSGGMHRALLEPIEGGAATRSSSNQKKTMTRQNVQSRSGLQTSTLAGQHVQSQGEMKSVLPS